MRICVQEKPNWKRRSRKKSKHDEKKENTFPLYYNFLRYNRMKACCLGVSADNNPTE